MNSPHDENRSRYELPSRVDKYDRGAGLQPAEQVLFERYLGRAEVRRLLDIGVGTGRTTEFLVDCCDDYVGIDYSSNMLDRCRQRLAHRPIVLELMDATELQFDDDSFDAVLFSFNGIDLIYPEQRREHHLQEVARVLRPGGHFIFSSHYPLMFPARPKLGGGLQRSLQQMKRFGEGLGRAVALIPLLVRGRGYFSDPDGDFYTYTARPDRVVRQVCQYGFRWLEQIRQDGGSTRSYHQLKAHWIYYAFQRV